MVTPLFDESVTLQRVGRDYAKIELSFQFAFHVSPKPAQMRGLQPHFETSNIRRPEMALASKEEPSSGILRQLLQQPRHSLGPFAPARRQNAAQRARSAAQ
jgi:hypothetical protein